MKSLMYTIIALSFVLGSCNSPNKNNLNEKASVHLQDELPENPLLLSPLTFSINIKQGSMSTLYGNDKAMQHAVTERNGDYPVGSVLYEVTWKQKADSLWYGANIPDEITQVERVLFKGNSLPIYELYTGHPLRKAPAGSSNERIAFIVSRLMASNP